MGMDQYLLIPFLGGWTSINPSYFDVNRRGTRFWHTAILKMEKIRLWQVKLWKVWADDSSSATGGLEHDFSVPNSWDDDPIWRTHIFQRAWNHQPDYY